MMRMDIRALVLVQTATEILADPAPISPFSPALLEVAGKSALQRTIERLSSFGIQQVTVVADSDFPPARATNGHGGSYLNATRERFWRAAETAFNDMAHEGAETVLLISLGGYAEVDFEKLVQFHLDHQARVSQACCGAQPLQVFCISASRRNDAASLFRSQLTKCRMECPLFEYPGYFNPLNDARDLRQFAVDILTLQVETLPSGAQLKPGVWVEPRAVIEKGARVLAPSFIGAFAKVRAHVVVTRCSSVEHHSHVDLGTVVENSSILPYCRVGAGLDLAHSVVGAGVLANLRRSVTVEVTDRKLVGYIPAAAGHRRLNAAMEFATHLPKQAWQDLFGRSGAQPDLQTALRQPSPTLGGAAGYQSPACDTDAAEEFSTNLAAMRRYGNQ